MPHNSFKLNGVAKELSLLTGVSFSFIPASENITAPLCPEKQYCPAKDFASQRTLCFESERTTITNFQQSQRHIQRFTCGLVEIIFPLFNGNNFQGVIISNKIQEKNGRSRISGKSTIPCLTSKQISALASLLQYYRDHFQKAIVLHQTDIPYSKDTITIQKAKEFIDTNYHTTKISLKELAREVHISYFSLCRLFKKELNMTFTQYMTLIRLRETLRLLQNLNLTIGQIAYTVGFSEAQYLDRVFKKTLGCTPKEFRNSSPAKREQIKKKVHAKLP
ncbi:helix-turn-helix transcriptional regulator [Candidatus Omnitrophota bacterium]